LKTPKAEISKRVALLITHPLVLCRRISKRSWRQWQLLPPH
jgi:hypothetical protein